MWIPISEAPIACFPHFEVAAESGDEGYAFNAVAGTPGEEEKGSDAEAGNGIPTIENPQQAEQTDHRPAQTAEEQMEQG